MLQKISNLECVSKRLDRVLSSAAWSTLLICSWDPPFLHQRLPRRPQSQPTASSWLSFSMTTFSNSNITNSSYDSSSRTSSFNNSSSSNTFNYNSSINNSNFNSS